MNEKKLQKLGMRPHVVLTCVNGDIFLQDGKGETPILIDKSYISSDVADNGKTWVALPKNSSRKKGFWLEDLEKTGQLDLYLNANVADVASEYIDVMRREYEREAEEWRSEKANHNKLLSMLNDEETSMYNALMAKARDRITQAYNDDIRAKIKALEALIK